MSEEIDKRLAQSRKDRSSMTEIISNDHDSIEEIRITFKTGRIMVIR